MALFMLPNGAMQTTAAMAAVTTGTAIKTMLQVQPSATATLRLVEWGISFDGSAAATPIKVELIETDVAATVTAFAAADITKLDGEALNFGNVTTNLIQVGTANSGFTASVEGNTTSTRDLAPPQFIAPTTQYQYQWPLGNYPLIQSSKFMRIRVTAGTAVNCYCYVIVQI